LPECLRKKMAPDEEVVDGALVRRDSGWDWLL